MYAPRTVKTLTALFFAMILGTLVLWLMDVDPIRPAGTHLAAVEAAEDAPLAVIMRTEKPHTKWNSIIVHGSGEGRAVLENCHFVVEPSGGPSPRGVRAGAAWLSQQESAHLPGTGRALYPGAIGVCIQGDFSTAPPSDEQWKSLIKLVTGLQRQFGIPAGRVYRYGSIAGSDSPGAAFPARLFNESLVAVR